MMDLIGQHVIHKLFGEGMVIAQDNNQVSVSFAVGCKNFTFPDAFDKYLTLQDATAAKYVCDLLTEKETERLRGLEDETQKAAEIQRRKSSVSNLHTPIAKKNRRTNVAFKCNFCDGGRSDEQVGFEGVCSDKIIRNNITVEKKVWCNADKCACLDYQKGRISRIELEANYNNRVLVCYESQMFRDWKAYAGVVQKGDNKNAPMRLLGVQKNSLAVLTTRDPKNEENLRYIFAVFLVEDTYEGDGREEGYVSAHERYRIKLTPKEARLLRFWNFHLNQNNKEKIFWGSGLHRYMTNEQSAQILRDVMQVKTGTQDEQLAAEFFDYYCVINGVDKSTLEAPKGALMHERLMPNG